MIYVKQINLAFLHDNFILSNLVITTSVSRCLCAKMYCKHCNVLYLLFIKIVIHQMGRKHEKLTNGCVLHK